MNNKEVNVNKISIKTIEDAIKLGYKKKELNDEYKVHCMFDVASLDLDDIGKYTGEIEKFCKKEDIDEKNPFKSLIMSFRPIKDDIDEKLEYLESQRSRVVSIISNEEKRVDICL
jgi:hypothetical protein